MADYIDREQALGYPLSYDHYDKKNGDIKFINGVESYREYIDGLPSVDAVEQKHGHWIVCTDFGNGCREVKCSECGETGFWRNRPLYCPHCGTRMDEVTE